VDSKAVTSVKCRCHSHCIDAITVVCVMLSDGWRRSSGLRKSWNRNDARRKNSDLPRRRGGSRKNDTSAPSRSNNAGAGKKKKEWKWNAKRSALQHVRLITLLRYDDSHAVSLDSTSAPANLETDHFLRICRR